MPLFKRSGSDQASTRSVVLRRGSLLAVPGLAEAWQSGWELCWQQISLDALHGFPVWVREVHDALVRAPLPRPPAPHARAHTPDRHAPQAAALPVELVLIFSHYCKSLQPSAVAFSLELGVSEFLEFARDVGVTTDAYGQPRVVAAFDAAAKRPAPESLPSRGKQLSYPDFLQLLVTVAFERDNPQYRPAGGRRRRRRRRARPPEPRRRRAAGARRREGAARLPVVVPRRRRPVFAMLRAAQAELRAIFDAYASAYKRGTFATEARARTMDADEWMTFVREAYLLSDKVGEDAAAAAFSKAATAIAASLKQEAEDAKLAAGGGGDHGSRGRLPPPLRAAARRPTSRRSHRRRRRRRRSRRLCRRRHPPARRRSKASCRHWSASRSRVPTRGTLPAAGRRRRRRCPRRCGRRSRKCSTAPTARAAIGDTADGWRVIARCS